MKELKFVKDILKFLDVECEVKCVKDERGILISCFCEDAGQLIGRQGRTINALRRILHTYGSRLEEIISIKVNPKD